MAILQELKTVTRKKHQKSEYFQTATELQLKHPGTADAAFGYESVSFSL